MNESRRQPQSWRHAARGCQGSMKQNHLRSQPLEEDAHLSQEEEPCEENTVGGCPPVLASAPSTFNITAGTSTNHQAVDTVSVTSTKQRTRAAVAKTHTGSATHVPQNVSNGCTEAATCPSSSLPVFPPRPRTSPSMATPMVHTSYTEQLAAPRATFWGGSPSSSTKSEASARQLFSMSHRKPHTHKSTGSRQLQPGTQGHAGVIRGKQLAAFACRFSADLTSHGTHSLAPCSPSDTLYAPYNTWDAIPNAVSHDYPPPVSARALASMDLPVHGSARARMFGCAQAELRPSVSGPVTNAITAHLLTDTLSSGTNSRVARDLVSSGAQEISSRSTRECPSDCTHDPNNNSNSRDYANAIGSGLHGLNSSSIGVCSIKDLVQAGPTRHLTASSLQAGTPSYPNHLHQPLGVSPSSAQYLTEALMQELQLPVPKSTPHATHPTKVQRHTHTPKLATASQARSRLASSAHTQPAPSSHTCTPHSSPLCVGSPAALASPKPRSAQPGFGLLSTAPHSAQLCKAAASDQEGPRCASPLVLPGRDLPRTQLLTDRAPRQMRMSFDSLRILSSGRARRNGCRLKSAEEVFVGLLDVPPDMPAGVANALGAIAALHAPMLKMTPAEHKPSRTGDGSIEGPTQPVSGGAHTLDGVSRSVQHCGHVSATGPVSGNPAQNAAALGQEGEGAAGDSRHDGLACAAAPGQESEHVDACGHAFSEYEDAVLASVN